MIRINLVAAVLLFAFSLCQAAEPQIRVAKVDLRELEPLLLEVAFASPENHAIRDRYTASQERERAMLAGELDPEEAARGLGLGMWQDRDAIEELARGVLIVLIEELFEGRYQLVIDDSYDRGVLYTEVVIPDITPNIKQRLLKDRTASQTQPTDTPTDTPAE